MLEIDLRFPRRHFLLDIQCSFANGIGGIFGPSGAGKSTLFSLIAGLERPQSGHIRLDDRVLVDTGRGIWRSPREREVGVVFQEGRLFPHYSVEGNLRYGERLLPPTRRRVAYDQIVDLLELRPLLRARPGHCSGGERQRVALGRALLCSPRVLLLDEPFSALDRDLCEQILPFLRRLHHLLDIPVLVVSHDLELLERLTSRLTVVNGGRVVAAGIRGESPELDALLARRRPRHEPGPFPGGTIGSLPADSAPALG